MWGGCTVPYEYMGRGAHYFYIFIDSRILVSSGVYSCIPVSSGVYSEVQTRQEQTLLMVPPLLRWLGLKTWRTLGLAGDGDSSPPPPPQVHRRGSELDRQSGNIKI